MTYTRAIGLGANKIIRLIVRGLALSKINPNVLTFLGLVINIVAATFLAIRKLPHCRLRHYLRRAVRHGGRARRPGDQPSDPLRRIFRFGAGSLFRLALLMGLLVYYGTINRPFYVVLTAIVMTASVMISYTRTRAENIIPACKVGFLERPERVVLLIIGALFDRMAPVLWVIAVLGNLTVIHRMIFTYQESKRLEDAQLRTRSVAASGSRSS